MSYYILPHPDLLVVGEMLYTFSKILNRKPIMEDYELEDVACPKCDHHPIHSRDCSNIHCNDGYIIERCPDCNGIGIERWCPSCGYDISANPENLAIDFSDEH